MAETENLLVRAIDSMKDDLAGQMAELERTLAAVDKAWQPIARELSVTQRKMQALDKRLAALEARPGYRRPGPVDAAQVEDMANRRRILT